MILALAILAMLTLYTYLAIQTTRRLVWHFCRNKSRYERDGSYMGAVFLATLLPVGAAVLWQLDRTYERGGAASFMLPPRKVRQEEYIRTLERKLDIR